MKASSATSDESRDDLAPVLDAIAGGASRLRIVCTSRLRRYRLAGRVTAALAAARRVLMTYPIGYVAMAPGMLRGRDPDGDVGRWRDERRVTLVPFDRLDRVRLTSFEVVEIPSGRRSDIRRRPHPGRGHADRAIRGVTVELALPHSRQVLAARRRRPLP